MADSVLNLVTRGQQIPNLVVVDTNVIRNFLLASFFAPRRSPAPLHVQQATQFSEISRQTRVLAL